MAYLERHVGARRGHGGSERVAGQGLLAVGFDHRQSRAGDPLLHTHLVVANRVQGPDGRWTALDGRDFYRHRLAADAIYRATYQYELTHTLGIAWGEADQHGNRPIVGLDERVVRAFAKRTDAIELALEQLEAEGRRRTPRLVKWVVQQTRTAKEHGVDEQTLRGRWAAEVRALGLDPAELVRAVRGRATVRTLTEPEAEPLLDRLAGPEGLTEHASTFAREDVLVALGAELAGTDAAGLERLADRLCAARAVPVVAGSEADERRWSTPELLATERTLVDAAVGRAADGAGTLAHAAVRAALQAHPTIGPDQAAMVRDVGRSPAGVQLVVGHAGTGKTYALGVVRHAAELASRRTVAAAPTGIATMSLGAEGFEDVRTVDRLLADLDQRGERLDANTVLVVDEAGMVGTRRLARLLAAAERGKAKVLLAGDDRQLPAIDAAGGFRALRLRLGASELAVNRRQHQAWEREALELVRVFAVDEAVAAYRAHGRVVAAETKQELTRALLGDWWQAFGGGDSVVILAHRRDEVDRLNSVCQQLMARAGRLGAERIRVGGRELAVGDAVVCGQNALARLGVANGSRGVVTALDRDVRTLTVRLDGTDGREVLLPAWYLDGRRARREPRRVDLAYATTGHKAQGLTKERALVWLTGHEDAEWTYVQLSRAKRETRIYTVVGPEPAVELDLAPAQARDADQRLARAIGRSAAQVAALDTHDPPDLRRLSTAEVRAERDALDRLFAQAPKDRGRELGRATGRRQRAEQVLAAARHGHTAAAAAAAPRSLRRRPVPEAARALARAEATLAQALAQADAVADAEQALRAHQQQRVAWLEAHTPEWQRARVVDRELAWRTRATGTALAVEQPRYLTDFLGPLPASTRGRRAWRQTAAAVEDYRQRHGISDPDRALGPEPRGDLAQRQAWRALGRSVERLWAREQTKPTGRERIGPERAVG